MGTRGIATVGAALALALTASAWGLVTSPAPAAEAKPDLRPLATQTLTPEDSEVVRAHGRLPDGPRPAPNSGAPGGQSPAQRAQAATFDDQVLSPGSPPIATTGQRGTEAQAPTVNTAFTGMTQLSSSAAGWGFPPDTIVGATGNRVIQAVNRRIKMTDTAGGLAATRTLDAFFKGTTSNSMFDPKVFYDRNAANPRVYVVALDGSSTARSEVHLAVSRSANPTSLAAGSWCRYVFNARQPVAGRPVTWADYPALGTGPNALVLTTNQFSDAGAFQYNAIWAFNKNRLAANGTACPSATRFNWAASATNGDLSAFTIQPVQHYTNPSSATGIAAPAYLVSSYAGTGSLYRIWRVYNLASGAPLLQVANLFGSYTYGAPPLSPGGINPATGAATGIDSGDTRVLQAAGVANRLHATHTTACQFTVGTSLEVCARYVAFDVGTSPGGGIAAAIRQQTTNGGGDGWFYHHPSLAVNNAGAVGSAFNVNSVGGFSSSAYATKGALDNDFPGEFYLAEGTCLPSATFQPSRGYNRSGDYNGAQTSPDGTTFWVAAERSVFIAGVGCGWQTTVGRLTHG